MFQDVMKNENMIDEQLIRLAYSKNIKIHITLNNNSWRNGFVKKLDNNFFIFEDLENGEEPFFYAQLTNVEPFTEVEK